MSYPTERDVKKIGPVVRGLAAFVLLCGLVAGAGLAHALVTEPFELPMLVSATVIGLMGHVAGSVVFRGYAPKYFLFAHGPK